MNVRHDAALSLGAGPPAKGSAERKTALDRQSAAAAYLSNRYLRIDQAALTRFAAVLTLLVIGYLVSGPSRNESEWGLVNSIGPAALCLAGLWTGYKLVTTNPRTIWTPLPWFTLTAATYFGFGPLIYPFGSKAGISYLDGAWSVYPVDLWRTNLLNTAGLLTITVAFLITDKLLDTDSLVGLSASRAVRGGDDPAKTAAVIFLGTGLPLRYLLVLPYQFGQLGIVLPGSLYTLNSLSSIGLFMLSYLGVKRGGLWRGSFWLLFVMEIVTNFICFSKLQSILVFIMVALGRYLARRNIKEFGLAGIGVLCLYVVLGPLVSWSRDQVAFETGDSHIAPFSVRFSIAARGLDLWSRGAIETDSSKQYWWGRLCYTNMEAAAMNLYDSGSSGDSFSVALYGWIPRFLWPDKPVVSLGEDFTILIKGKSGVGTATGPAIFGEAYWNGGWFVVVLACGYVGVVFAWIARTSLLMLARSEWLLLPCAFLGIMMGMRMDTWFAPNYITGFALFLVYYFLIRLVMGVIQYDG
jgi:hypothetical protein